MEQLRKIITRNLIFQFQNLWDRLKTNVYFALIFPSSFIFLINKLQILLNHTPFVHQYKAMFDRARILRNLVESE